MVGHSNDEHVSHSCGSAVEADRQVGTASQWGYLAVRPTLIDLLL